MELPIIVSINAIVPASNVNIQIVAPKIYFRVYPFWSSALKSSLYPNTPITLTKTTELNSKVFDPVSFPSVQIATIAKMRATIKYWIK